MFGFLNRNGLFDFFFVFGTLRTDSFSHDHYFSYFKRTGMPPHGLVTSTTVVCIAVYHRNATSRVHAVSPLCLRLFSFLRKLLSPVGYLYNKAKSGLGKIRESFVSSKKKAIRDAIENGEVRLRLDDWGRLSGVMRRSGRSDFVSQLLRVLYIWYGAPA